MYIKLVKFSFVPNVSVQACPWLLAPASAVPSSVLAQEPSGHSAPATLCAHLCITWYTILQHTMAQAHQKAQQHGCGPAASGSVAQQDHTGWLVKGVRFGSLRHHVVDSWTLCRYLAQESLKNRSNHFLAQVVCHFKWPRTNCLRFEW